MSVLVTGANGFVGYYLSKLLVRKKIPVIATGRGPCRVPLQERSRLHYVNLDFCNQQMVHSVLQQYRPHCIIHAGAMCQPDYCEQHQPEAYETNVTGTMHLLHTAASAGARFIYVSTDFVFDGESGPYSEEDKPAPVNYYGHTKWMAEKAVQIYQHPWAIVRTVLVYGASYSGRQNLVETVRRKLESGEEYQVVSDQFRTPTYVEDLSWALAEIAEKEHSGIFHISGAERLTPYDMGIATARHLGLDETLIKKVTADCFTQPALRPPKTGFIIQKARAQLGFSPVPFLTGLEKMFGKK